MTIWPETEESTILADERGRKGGKEKKGKGGKNFLGKSLAGK